MLKLFAFLFAILDRLAPGLGGRYAVSLFYAPRRFPAAKWEQAGLSQGRTAHYAFNGEQLDATVWGESGPTVLLAHGWEGRRGQLSKIALALQADGFRVVAIDGPAHGSSQRKRTTLVEFSQAVEAAAAAFGPLHGIVGHSFGSAAAAIAIRRGVAAQRVVLISCPFSLRNVVGGFARLVGVPSRTFEAMFPVMAELHRCPEAELSFEAIGPDLALPALFIHDENDRYIPFRDAERVHGLVAGAELRRTIGLGHMRILQDDAVIRAAAAFVAVGAR